jgi:hypothetical protein
MANPDALIVQLRTVVEKPDAFKEQRQEIMELTRKAALALEDPFEIFQRLVYSVCLHQKEIDSVPGLTIISLSH